MTCYNSKKEVDVKDMTKDINRFTLRLPRQLFEKLKAEADKIGVSCNALILQILWDWSKEPENKF